MIETESHNSENDNDDDEIANDVMIWAPPQPPTLYERIWWQRRQKDLFLQLDALKLHTVSFVIYKSANSPQRVCNITQCLPQSVYRESTNQWTTIPGMSTCCCCFQNFLHALTTTRLVIEQNNVCIHSRGIPNLFSVTQIGWRYFHQVLRII